ncbi:hypothetical protein [Streptomyces californicus]|uniref:hypothetical protein n=1 Tax=Streptomyces californicus TaxID=67351 RepID=UPI0033DEAD44
MSTAAAPDPWHTGQMRVLGRQLLTTATLLEEAGVTAPLTITCHCEEGPSVELLASDRLSIADQRTVVDRVAALLGAIPSVKRLFGEQYAVFCEGYRDGFLIIASTHSGTPRPAVLEPASDSSDTAAFLRSILSWATAPRIQTLVVRETAGSHAVTAWCANARDAEAALAGLVPETQQGRGIRALLPTGHPVTVRVSIT